MEDFSKTDIIVKHLNALHSARKAFIEAESNEKLRPALKANNNRYYLRNWRYCLLQI